MPEDEFLLLAQACDMFEVVMIEKGFVAATKEKFAADFRWRKTNSFMFENYFEKSRYIFVG